MNLKERLAELLKELDAAETLEDAKRIKGEIEAVQSQIALADEKAGILDSMKASKPVAGNRTEAKAASLGEHFAKAAEGHVAKGQRFSFAAPEFEKAAVVMTTPSSIAPALTDVDTRLVEGYRRPLMIADLFGSESISGTAITYFVENSSVEGAFAAVAENGTKPQISFGDPTAVTESLKKIAAYYKESDEIIEDAEWLASSINNRALYLHDLAEETQLLSGDGTGQNLTGILSRSGIGSKTYAHGGTVGADVIFEAMMAVQNNSGFAADAIVINPTDYQRLRLAKDSNNQYYGGGYFYGAYGNTPMAEQPNLWGLRTVVTPAITAGTVLVGAFKAGGSVIRKGGTTVEMVNTNEADFINNRVTIRVENRLALAVRYPAAFVKITENPT